jgi:hypothetical protein
LQQLAGRLHTQLRDTLVHFQQTEDRQNLIQAYHAATDTIMGRWRDGSLAILGRVPEGRAALYRRLEAEASQALERLSSTRQRGYELLLHRFSDPRAEELYPDYAPPTPSGTTDATGAQAPDTIHMPAPQRLPR